MGAKFFFSTIFSDSCTRVHEFFFFQLFFQIHVPGYTKFADRKMAISCTRVHESEKNYFRARIMFNTPKVAFWKSQMKSEIIWHHIKVGKFENLRISNFFLKFFFFWNFCNFSARLVLCTPKDAFWKSGMKSEIIWHQVKVEKFENSRISLYRYICNRKKGYAVDL